MEYSQQKPIIQINSLSTWMADLKKNYSTFAQKTIKDIIIPGTHHSGLLSTQQLRDYTNQWAEIQITQEELQSWIELPEDYKFRQLQKLNVDQRHSIAEELKMGARYLDIRISADLNDPTKVYLAHWLQSNITMESQLQAINKFLEQNPEEIIIIKLQNDGQGPLKTMALVTQEVADGIIKNSGITDKILPRENVNKPIGEYRGGVYIFGQCGFVTSYENIIYKTSWSLTKSPSPKTLGENVYKYFAEEWYAKQEPLDYDIIEGQVLLTAKKANKRQTINNSIRLFKEKKEEPVDPFIIEKNDSGNVLGQTPLTNTYFMDLIEGDLPILKKLNLLTFDGYDASLGLRVINLNRHKIF